MRRSGGIVAAAMLVAMAATPVAGGSAERLGGGSGRLESELRALRTRVERAPRATGHELDRARRELAERRLETPDDPRLMRLDQEILDLQWRADRAARRAAGFSGRAALGPVLSDPLGPAEPRRREGTRVPVGVGKRVILIQNGLREAEAGLGQGRVGEARAQLARAETALAGLRAELGAVAADDPNLVALDAEIEALGCRVGFFSGNRSRQSAGGAPSL